MNSIAGIENAKKVLGDFAFSEFCVVRELRYYEAPENSASAQNIDLVIESTGRISNYRMKMIFAKVSGLKLEGFGGGKFRITGLNISNVSSRQWDGVNWEVNDFEGIAIEFQSFSALVVSVEQVPK